MSLAMAYLKGCFLCLFTMLRLSLGLAASVCQDVSTAVCSDLASNVSKMCDNSCLADICKDFCGKCHEALQNKLHSIKPKLGSSRAAPCLCCKNENVAGATFKAGDAYSSGAHYPTTNMFGALKCYECHEIDQPQQCNTSVTCPSNDHYCGVTQSFTDDFREVYKLGCALNNICATNFPESNFVIGKRDENQDQTKLKRSGTHIDGGCCTENLCNNKSPMQLPVVAMPTSQSAQTSATTQSSVCSDINSASCTKLLAAMPNMCDTDCIATSVCPRTCGKCFECYDCPHVSNIQDCNNTITCQPGQECYALETLSTTTFQHGYHLGCMNADVCKRFYTEVPNAFGRRQSVEVSVQGICCQSDLCNDHMVQPTTTPTTTTPTTTTTIVPVTTPPHTNFPVCSVHIGTCPRGYTFVKETNSCYKAVRTPKTWRDAKLYCRQHCADLSDFKSNGEASYIAELIQLGIIDFSSNFNQNEAFYVDANSESGSWKWNATGQAISSQMMGYSSNSAYHCGVFIVPAKYSHVASNYRFMAEVPCTNHHYFLCEIKNVHA